MEQQGLELSHYTRLLWKGKWVILLTALVSIIGVIVFTGLQPEPAPSYRATATVKVEAVDAPTAVANASSVLSSDRSLNTEIQLIGSRNVMERALFKLQPDSVNNLPEVVALQIAQLQRDISVRAVLNTNLLEIRAQGNSPANAQSKANAIVAAYIDYVKEAQFGAIQDALNGILTELAGVERPDGPANNPLAVLLPTLGSELATIASSVEKSRQVIAELQLQQDPTTVGISLQQEVPQIERAAKELSTISQDLQGMSGNFVAGNSPPSETTADGALGQNAARLEMNASDLNLIYKQIDDIRGNIQNLDPTRSFELAIARSDDAQSVLLRVPIELGAVRSSTLATAQEINSIVSYAETVVNDLKDISARLQSALDGTQITQSERVILGGQLLAHTRGLTTAATDLGKLRERGRVEDFDGADIGKIAATEGNILTAVDQIDLLATAFGTASDTSTLGEDLSQSLSWIRESSQGIITVSNNFLRVPSDGDPQREADISARAGIELEKYALTLGVAASSLRKQQSAIIDPLLQAKMDSAIDRLTSAQSEIISISTRMTGRSPVRTVVATLDSLKIVGDRVQEDAKVLSDTLKILRPSNDNPSAVVDADAAIQAYNNTYRVVLSLDVASRQLESLTRGNLDPLLSGELGSLSDRLTLAYNNIRVLSDRLASLASEDPIGQNSGGLGAATFRLEFAVETLRAAAKSAQSGVGQTDIELLSGAADEFKKQTDSGIANLSQVADDLAGFQNAEATSPLRYGQLAAAAENIKLARDRAFNLSSQLQQLQESRGTRYFELQQLRAELELSLLQPQNTGITLVDSPVSVLASASGSTFFSSVRLPLAAIAGVFLGSLAVLLKAQIIQAVASPSQLRNRLGMTILGVIPVIRRSRRSTSRTSPVEQDSLIFSEAMQLVGASLSGPLSHGSHSLLVTSAVPREGKTAVTIHLARVLAQYGHRVIVVDGNLRKPEVAQRLGLTQQEGLSNALSRQKNPVEYIVETPTFSALPGGQPPPNPVELLSSPAMSSFLQQLLNRYDVVLIDSAPAIGFAEIRTLASIVSGAILVVNGTVTSFDLVRTAKDELEAAGVPLVGTVINFAPDEECTHLKHDNYRPGKVSNDTSRRSRRSGNSETGQSDQLAGEELPSLTLR